MTVKTYVHVEGPTETRKVAGSTPALALALATTTLNTFRPRAKQLANKPLTGVHVVAKHAYTHITAKTTISPLCP